MRLQKTKVLTGATLSLLLSLTTIYPAIAQSARGESNSQTIAQMDDTASIRGKIKSIVGNVVTLELSDGSTQDVMISRTERERLGLSPGMEIMTSMRNGSLVVEVVNADSGSTATTDNSSMSSQNSSMSSQNSSMSSESSSEAITSGTTRRRVVEETVIQRRTTTTPAVEQNTEQTTGDVQQSAQEVQQNTQMTTQQTTQRARPVRALW